MIWSQLAFGRALWIQEQQGLRRAPDQLSLQHEPGLRWAQAPRAHPPVGRSGWEPTAHGFAGRSRDCPRSPQRQTVGAYVGLCLLVQFPDIPSVIDQSEVEAFCNKKGYSNFGNNGSVHDYFFAVSDARLSYTNVIAPYYTTKHPRSYYTNEAIPQPQRAQELIKEALAYHLGRGFDFSSLTADNQQYVYALNVFYAGVTVNNWAKGLWPHAYHLQTPYQLAPGKFAHDYQITDLGNELSLGTFCHENGHMLCDFPDLYDYGYESYGAGVYCLMCGGGSYPNEKNPGQIGAYLKHGAGWTSAATNLTPGKAVTLAAGRNEFAIYRKSGTEYFILENRARAGRDVALTDAGLAVWHVDELGSNSNEQMSPSSHYECALVQADDQNHLENRVNNGDNYDLFQAGENDQLSDTTSPSCRWWDNSNSGLAINNVSVAGPSITFYTK